MGGKNKKVQTKDKGKGKITKAKSRLTDSVIDKLQNYFGIALRSNVGDLQKMQDAILARLFHVASLDIFEGLNIIPGVYATTMCNMLNKRRKYNASLHNKPSAKKRRKVLRGEKKKKSDKHFLTEVKSYETGGF